MLPYTTARVAPETYAEIHTSKQNNIVITQWIKVNPDMQDVLLTSFPGPTPDTCILRIVKLNFKNSQNNLPLQSPPFPVCTVEFQA